MARCPIIKGGGEVVCDEFIEKMSVQFFICRQDSKICRRNTPLWPKTSFWKRVILSWRCHRPLTLLKLRPFKEVPLLKAKCCKVAF